ncbi:hypothetical protein ES708_01785 [subsurface metagenome]
MTLAKAKENLDTKNTLPHGWNWVLLEDLFDVKQGAAMSPVRRQGIAPHPFLRTLNVLWGSVDLSNLDQMDFTEDEVASLNLRSGDLLVCEGGDVGRTAIWRGELDSCLYQNHIHRLRRRHNNVAPEFYAYWMQAAFKVFQSYIGKEITTTIPNLSGGKLKSFMVPLPPTLTEQERIAQILNERMVAIEKAYAAADVRIEAAKALPAAYLRQVLPQPGQELPDGWRWVRLGEVCEFLDSQRVPVNDEERQQRIAGRSSSSLYPYYGANGQVGWIDDYIFDEPLILLAEDGGFFGSPERPVAYKIIGKSWVNNHAHVLRPRNGVDFDFCLHALAIRPDIGTMVTGNTRPKLNQEIAAQIPIPLPSLVEQKRIAAMLNERMEAVGEIVQTIQQELDAINGLPAAFLRRAFTGGL